MPILPFSLVACLACVSHVAHAGCSGPSCAGTDTSELLLATKTHVKTDHAKLAEESAHMNILPKLATFTKNADLSSLLALQSTVERVLNNEPNETDLTGWNRTYDPNEKEESAVETIRGFLATFINGAKDAHRAGQQSLDDWAAEVLDKHTKGKAKLLEVDSDFKEREAARKAHSDCRTAEAGLESTKTTHCDNYAGSILQPLDPAFATIAALWPTVKSHNSAQQKELQSAIVAAAQFLTLNDGLKKCNGNATCLHVEEKSLVVSAQACETVEDEREKKRSQCNSDQVAFEDADCKWQGDDDSACTDYDTDFDRVMTKFLTQKAVQIEQANTRKAEHVAAKRVGCYLNVLIADQVNKTDMVKACRDAVHSTDHLNIVIPSVPAKYSCTLRGFTESQKTCGADWLQSEYKDKSWYTNAPTEACKPCATEAPTPAPTTEAERKLLSARYPLVPGMEVSMSLSSLGGSCYTQHCPSGGKHCDKAGQRYYNSQELVSQLAESMGMECKRWESCHDHVSPAIKPDGTCCHSQHGSACGSTKEGWYRFCGCVANTGTYPVCDNSGSFPCRCGQELCDGRSICDNGHCYEATTPSAEEAGFVTIDNCNAGNNECGPGMMTKLQSTGWNNRVWDSVEMCWNCDIVGARWKYSTGGRPDAYTYCGVVEYDDAASLRTNGNHQFSSYGIHLVHSLQLYRGEGGPDSGYTEGHISSQFDGDYVTVRLTSTGADLLLGSKIIHQINRAPSGKYRFGCAPYTQGSGYTDLTYLPKA